MQADRHSRQEGYLQDRGIFWQQYGCDADPALVLIRGLGSQLIHWPEALLQRFADAGYRVIVFDNRDSGLSHKHTELSGTELRQRLQAAWRLRNAGESHQLVESHQLEESHQLVQPAYRLADMAEDVLALLDYLDISRAHILGASMGGMIAQIFAAHWPQRTSSLTVVFSTTLDTQLPKGPGLSLLYDDSAEVTDKSSEQVHELPEDPEIFSAWVAAAAIEGQQYTGTTHQMSETAQLSLAERALRRSYCPEGYSRQLLAILAEAELCEQNRLIDVPALVLHGDADPIFPVACAESIADSIANARCEVLAGWGHDLPESMHDWFFRQVNSLLMAVEAEPVTL